MKIKVLKRKKNSWSHLGFACYLNSTANSANFHQNWAGLTVLFSWKILNGSQDFFFSFFRAFLTLNILAVGRVFYISNETNLLQNIFLTKYRLSIFYGPKMFNWLRKSSISQSRHAPIENKMGKKNYEGVDTWYVLWFSYFHPPAVFTRYFLTYSAYSGPQEGLKIQKCQ